MAVQYQTLVEEVRALAGLPDSDAASMAAQATLAALGPVLDQEARSRLAEAVPGHLRPALEEGHGQEEEPRDGRDGRRTGDPVRLLRAVAERCHCSPEQARLRVQATLAVLREHEPELVGSLHLPDGFEDLLERPDPGGGLVTATGRTPPLTPEELEQALSTLPDWEGDTSAISRTVALPEENLDGLAPHVERVVHGSGAELVREAGALTVRLRTRSVGAVTEGDVELARRVDEVLGTVSPAIAAPRGSGTTPPGTWSRSPEVLFGGTGLQGWRMSGPGRFEIIDGALHSRGGMGLLWYGEREFTDFTLTLDWRVERPEDNSGVFVRFPDPGDDPWVAVHEGYEVQICDAEQGDRGTGAIYTFAAPHTDVPVNPPGEWNHLELQVRGQTYRVGVNGREVTSFTGSRRVSGYVGLQNHDEESRVQFRDVFVFDESGEAGR